MAATATSAVPDQPLKAQAPGQVPFDLSHPPDIEGFTPLTKSKDENFKEKFLRKTKENPFVPIGELHKQDSADGSVVRGVLHYSWVSFKCYIITLLCSVVVVPPFTFIEEEPVCVITKLWLVNLEGIKID
ncbi:hypothetical protein ILYODFUR_037439 [Ilyodon furcidens]|uniref:Uncharacterized protein n=1 Tax=Ilyodon furcidens TaxID=33524 RepID=A0ABV0UCX8_9TELE